MRQVTDEAHLGLVRIFLLPVWRVVMMRGFGLVFLPNKCIQLIWVEDVWIQQISVVSDQIFPQRIYNLLKDLLFTFISLSSAVRLLCIRILGLLRFQQVVEARLLELSHQIVNVRSVLGMAAAALVWILFLELLIDHLEGLCLHICLSRTLRNFK